LKEKKNKIVGPILFFVQEKRKQNQKQKTTIDL